MTTPVNFSSEGPPETILPTGPQAALDALEAAGDDRLAVAEVVAAHPRLLAGWARLGSLAEQAAQDTTGSIEAYAYYRIGYHRGLDALRQNGWRGSGYVRWAHETNRGFLGCLDGLGRVAGLIGETDEHERCGQFLRQLDPDWPPS
jgi:hypothetical protein